MAAVYAGTSPRATLVPHLSLHPKMCSAQGSTYLPPTYLPFVSDEQLTECGHLSGSSSWSYLQSPNKFGF